MCAVNTCKVAMGTVIISKIVYVSVRMTLVNCNNGSSSPHHHHFIEVGKSLFHMFTAITAYLPVHLKPSTCWLLSYVNVSAQLQYPSADHRQKPQRKCPHPLTERKRSGVFNLKGNRHEAAALSLSLCISVTDTVYQYMSIAVCHCVLVSLYQYHCMTVIVITTNTVICDTQLSKLNVQQQAQTKCRKDRSSSHCLCLPP